MLSAVKLSIPALLILASLGLTACDPTAPVSFHPKGGVPGGPRIPEPRAIPPATPVPTPPIDEGDPSFEMVSVSPATLDVEPGDAGTLQVIVERIDGHEGDITVSLVNLPAGVTAEPVVLSGSEVEAGVVVTADGAATILESVEAFARAEDVDGSRSRSFRVQVRGSDGDLDHSFGAGDGIAQLSTAGAAGVAALSDGRVLSASSSLQGTGAEAQGGIVVTRVLPSGAPDATFGSSGSSEILLGAGTVTQVAGLVALADGGVLVAGTVLRVSPDGAAMGSDVVLVRFDSQGTLSSAFGVKTLDLAPDESATSLLADATGAVVAGVGRTPGFEPQVFLARVVLTDGALDPAFGAGTGVVLETGADADYALAHAPGGKIVLSGATRTTRYLADGTRDATFGVAGDAITSTDGASRTVVVQDDGKILVAASHLGSPVVVRYRADGSPDAAFGTGGMTEIAGAGRLDALLVDATGRIVGAGRAGGDAAAFRLQADGTFDPDFAGGEVVRHDAGGTDAATGLALLDDGRLMLSAETTSAGEPVNGFLLRLWATP